MSGFDDWPYSVDREATTRAYRGAGLGGVDTCDCINCRNFRLVRAQAFPSEFSHFLGRLGIDPLKDGEVYHLGRQSPGRHRYAGWYHFVGTLAASEPLSPVQFGNGFTTWMCSANAPRLTTLRGLPCVQLEFDIESVPWLLDEPEE